MSTPNTPRWIGEDLTRSSGDTTGRTWTITMPPRQKLLNANDRPHWAKRARITRQLRSDAYKLAKAAKVPLLERAQIDCVYEPPDNRARDAANWADSAKPCADGFVDAGVLKDDSTAYLAGPFMHIGWRHPGGRLVLYIAELTTQTTHPNGDPS